MFTNELINHRIYNGFYPGVPAHVFEYQFQSIFFISRNFDLRICQACIVENESSEDPTMENVTFLYTLANGICPKSYGFFAAKISGLRTEVFEIFINE